MFNTGRRHDPNETSSEHPCHAGAVLEKRLPVTPWARPPGPAVGKKLQGFFQVNGVASLFATQPGVRQVLEITGTCSDRHTPSYGRHTGASPIGITFSIVQAGRRGSTCARERTRSQTRHDRHHGAAGVRNQNRGTRSGTTNPGNKPPRNRRGRNARMGATTAIEWRSVREVLTAVVRSTRPEARAVALTPVHDEMRKPVMGAARTRPHEPGMAAPTTTEARRRTRARRYREGGKPSCAPK